MNGGRATFSCAASVLHLLVDQAYQAVAVNLT